VNRLKCIVVFACALLFSFFSFSHAESGLALKADHGLIANDFRVPGDIELVSWSSPSQDTILGTYYLFTGKKGEKNSHEESTNLDVKVDKPEAYLSKKKDFFTVFLGAVYWETMGEIEPAFSGSDPGEFGRFKELGYNIELAYHRLVTQWLGNDIQLGIDFGLFYNGNEKKFEVTLLPSGEKLKRGLNSRGLYLTPSVRMLIGRYGSPRLFVGAGLGFYLVDFVEQLSDGMEVDEYFGEEALGGYLSVGMGFPLSSPPDKLVLRFEAKVHFVNFGDLEQFAPGAGDLKGPIYIFQVGLTF